MKSVLKIIIFAALVGFPLSVNSQVKIDLNKKVITIDKNAKANVKKAAAKDQGQNTKQNQGTQDSQAAVKNDNKSAVESNTNTDGQSSTQEQQSMQSFSTYDFVPGDKVILFDDFSQDAAHISDMLDLPVQWRDVSLDHLESVLHAAISHKLESLHAQ